MRETPWVSAVLGHCYGSSSWYAALADFCVMRKGAITAVSSIKLTSMAIAEKVDPEDLGGWKLHTEVTGMIDVATDTDEEALDLVRRFLSYLPSHHKEAPPVHPVPPESGKEAHRILEILPESRTKVYDVRKILNLIYDAGSLFELKPRFGRSVVTALARLDGKYGRHRREQPDRQGRRDRSGQLSQGGELPGAVRLVQHPADLHGRPAGLPDRRRGRTRRGDRARDELDERAVAGHRAEDLGVDAQDRTGRRCSTWAAPATRIRSSPGTPSELNFMDPRHAVTIVHNVREQDDPPRYQALLAEMTRDTSAYDAAATSSVHAVIDPIDTRDYLIRLLDVHRLRLTNGVGQHLMRTWPTSY